MENLSKDNFWNEIKEKYPEAFAHFGQWIDNYKKEVGWNTLFYCDSDGYCQVKFHEIPFEMQNGIIARFELELFNNDEGNGKAIADKISNKYRDEFKRLFVDLQHQITERAKKLN